MLFLIFAKRPVEGLWTKDLVSDEEALVEELIDNSGTRVNDVFESIQELGSHADFPLSLEEVQHNFKAQWTLFVQGQMEWSCLLSWLIPGGIAVQEHKRKHVYSRIFEVASCLFVSSDGVVNGFKYFHICRIDVED